MYNPSIHVFVDKSEAYVYIPVPYGEGKTVRPWLKAAIGKRAHISYTTCKLGNFWWLIKKGHTDKVRRALVEKYGSCEVTREYNTSQKCTTSCQRAEGDECVCVCLGQFHGHGESPAHSWKNVVGDLLVSSDRHRVTRHYTSAN